MSADPFSLAGKVAIVTGSSRGIGFAAARLLARQGAQVVISSRKAEACEAAVAALTGEGLSALAIPAHSANAEDCARLVERTCDALGGIDILVANAGVNPVFAPLHSLDEAAWAKTLDTNLAGPWRLASLALPHIAERSGGSVVFVSSINADFAVAGSGAYGLSKAALNAMTRQLAVEWGKRDVRVNSVAPSTTRTDMLRSLLSRPGFEEQATARTPLGRIADPEDIAGPIAFLASEAARHVSGQVITIDGGEGIMRGAAA
ncbi:MAG: SDR family NAD(P)-dependent oxidoreductase [Allosphingosinicella sp.]|uniref:SDR family NAD(P)-dependent oxidoreductase n=1 Tax=Allosphingosinicella sp. TaxID=2823234 RepID=UPI0039281C99